MQRMAKEKKKKRRKKKQMNVIAVAAFLIEVAEFAFAAWDRLGGRRKRRAA